jgi:hypothetical protein
MDKNKKEKIQSVQKQSKVKEKPKLKHGKS